MGVPCLFQELTAVIQKQVIPPVDQQEDTREIVPEEKVLLGIEEREEQKVDDFNRNLTVLHLLALLAEDVGPACFKTPRHILDFVKVSELRSL